ncbi:hypothetical protein [Azospirillum sp. TSA2s]|nr:hypothetical protein [Azospirillum sp. TSA2s]
MTDDIKLRLAWIGLKAVSLVCLIGAAFAAYGLYRVVHVASLTVGGL